MQATPGGLISAADHAVSQWGPIGAVVVCGCAAMMIFLWREAWPFIKKRTEQRDQLHDDLVNKALSHMDAARQELPQALDKVAGTFQDGIKGLLDQGKETHRKLDQLPDTVEQMFIKVMEKETGRK